MWTDVEQVWHQAPVVQPAVNLSGIQIAPVQHNSTSHRMGVDVSSVLGHLICKHRPLGQEGPRSRKEET